MPTSKLTLSVDAAVARRAKQYVKARGGSLSKAVTQFLAALSDGDAREDGLDLPPGVTRLAGILPARVDVAEYQAHLSAKHAL
jgi:hypothetical protein